MNPQDSTFGAALFLFASLAVAYLLWMVGHYAGRFHRAGIERLRRSNPRPHDPATCDCKATR